MSDERLIETFVDLVRIDSPSGAESLVAAYCAGALDRLGFNVRTDDTQRLTGADTGNVIAELPGDIDTTLVLSAHMDCVQPCEGVEPVVGVADISSAGDTVLGADDKAGVAAILEAVQRLIESKASRPNIRVVLTVSEEIGLQGAKALNPDDARGDLCLVLDADGPVGGIVTSAPTHYTFVATFYGKASHAGVAPEDGRSALIMAARAISAMKLGRIDEQTTANVGSIEGGTATNVIPARVGLTGECRSLNRERAEQQRQAMDTILHDAARAGGGTVDVSWTKEYEGFSYAEDSEPVRLVSAAARAVGLEPRTFSTGGGSDGNIFAAKGIPTLVLSCGMQSVHSTDERIALADLRALCELVESMSAVMARG